MKLSFKKQLNEQQICLINYPHDTNKHEIIDMNASVQWHIQMINDSEGVKIYNFHVEEVILKTTLRTYQEDSDDSSTTDHVETMKLPLNITRQHAIIGKAKNVCSIDLIGLEYFFIDDEENVMNFDIQM
jgi:hypothetical protein